MPRYPGATWRPVDGHTDGPMTTCLGIVLHVNQSNGNLYNWVDGDNNMSCHFQVYKSGLVEQYLDTAVTSWCQLDGNATYLSVETEGYATEALNASQVAALGKLLAWAHTTHGIPLQAAEHPGERGFGWHGMGGNAWGHPDCPGELRKAQRARILTLANPAPPPSGAFIMDAATTAAIQKMLDAQHKALSDELVHRILDDAAHDPHYIATYVAQVEARIAASEARIIAAINGR